MKNYDELANDTNYSFRISTELKEDFNKLCRKKLLNNSAVMRSFMIDFIKNNDDSYNEKR